ncbi:DNA repair protein RadC [Acidobacteriota bacterium]
MYIRVNQIREKRSEAVYGPNDVFRLVKRHSKLDRETLFILLFDAKNKLIAEELHTIGTVDSCSVYPREIVKSALLKNAVSIAMVHNHPSGNSEPSIQDIEITKRTIDACELLDIKVLDHIILGDSEFYSMSDHGDI